ncbi:monovalent cation/H+ antiporter complex subunit F [Lysinibacter sp. HNR]|uniref:monovalent cation/H+ antiporter complex subunit F n=1 Tax=Lysinibacter sp. HNR TaxID=3031408 RepID=UPI00243583FF|nr:monovalent cation/H+ antiporter complex subunit F [Lysinibacter sp. HNR]WGD36947.1 monovalent cation/H+ antiporter complex subunit F [Lysinibacter sp. HNR]
MNVAAVIMSIFLGIGAILAVIRIIVGPTALDRVLGLDVLLAIVLCALAGDMVINEHTNTLPLLVALAFFGVTGSISITRFISRRDEP